MHGASEIVTAVTPQQIEQARSLFREYRAEMPLSVCFGDFDTELLGLPGAYASPGGKLLLATIAGQPVGCVGLRPFPLPGVCEMKRLYVRPPFRDRRLGKLLVGRILDEARSLGYGRLRLDTYPPNMAAAVELYRRLGFHEIAADPLTPTKQLLFMEIAL